MVIVSFVSHCSCVIIHVPTPQMTSGLPNTAIKMQHRSWGLYFLNVFPDFQQHPHFLAWQHVVLSRAQPRLSGSACVDVLYPPTKGNLTSALLWAWSSSKRPQCPHTAGENAAVHRFRWTGAVGASFHCSKALGTHFYRWTLTWPYNLSTRKCVQSMDNITNLCNLIFINILKEK